MANNKKFVVKNGLQTKVVDFINANNATLNVSILDSSNTLVVTGNSGQLFSITDSMTGVIHSVNDISGIPSIEVYDTGEIRLAEFSGNVVIGANGSSTTDKVQINGNVIANIFKSTVTTGNAPLQVLSSTLVANLNADLLDGLNSTAFANANYTISAYDFANTVNIKVDSAYTFANTVNVRTQSSYDFANTVNVRTQFASDLANTVNVRSQSGYDFANTVNVRTQSSYDFANTVNVRTQFASDLANSSNIKVESAYAFVNTVNIRTQSAYDFGNTVNIRAQSGYDFANTVNVRTQAAFDKANTGSPSSGGTINYVRKTTTYTANSGDFIIADTSGGPFTITLPATPGTGNNVTFVDGSNWKANNLTIARNGSTIEGNADNLVLDIQSIRVDLVYDGTTWQVYGAVAGTYVGYTQNVGNGSANTFYINHNFDKQDVQVSVKEYSTGYLVFPDITMANNNTVILNFIDAPTSNQYRATVVGITA